MVVTLAKLALYDELIKVNNIPPDLRADQYVTITVASTPLYLPVPGKEISIFGRSTSSTLWLVILPYHPFRVYALPSLVFLVLFFCIFASLISCSKYCFMSSYVREVWIPVFSAILSWFRFVNPIIFLCICCSIWATPILSSKPRFLNSKTSNWLTWFWIFRNRNGCRINAYQ